MKPTTNTHGGARKGAGRKPAPNPTKAVTMRLTAQERAQLAQIAPTPAAAVRKLLQDRKQ